MSAKSKIVYIAVAALSLAAASSAFAAKRDVLVVNETNHTMVRLYASNIHDPSGHADILSPRVLKPGESIVMSFNDGTGSCLFAVRGEFNDNTYVQHSTFDVCREYRLTFTGD